MQAQPALVQSRDAGRFQAGWAILLSLSALVAYSVFSNLWSLWRGDPTFSHGPLVPLAAAGLLWVRRAELNRWESANFAGLMLLLLSTLVQILAVWADIVFMKPVSLIGMIAGGVWFLGGWRMLSASIGAIGFLNFMIPWPTLLIDKLAFPMQLMSSSYAAMMGGILGIPLVRDGVNIAVGPNPEAPPVYQMIVARQCSGLTSLVVLMALGYLIAYFTPAKLGWRALLFLSVIPLALLTNAVRLTVILVFGAHSSPEMAKWVHDNEGPVLIFICSVGLMGLRQLLLSWIAARHASPVEEGNTVVQIPNTSG